MTDILKKQMASKLGTRTVISSRLKILKLLAVNIDQIHSKAEHERASAELDLVRSMIELEDADLLNFKNALEMAEMIKMTNGGTSTHPSFKEKPIKQTA